MWEKIALFVGIALLAIGKKDIVSAANTAGGVGDMGDPSIPATNNIVDNLRRVRQWTPIVSRKLAQTSRLKNVFEVNDVLAIIYLESKGYTNLTNTAGEVGMMQVTPIAMADLHQNGYASNYDLDALKFDAELQIDAGVSYLDLICKKVGNDKNDIVKSYNVGYPRILSNPFYEPAMRYLNLFNEKLGRLKGN